MKISERSELLDSLLDGTIDEADLLRIEAELSVDPEVRQEYYRRIQLDLLLEREAATAVASASQPPTPKPAFLWFGRDTALAGALLAMAAGLVFALVLFPGNDVDRLDETAELAAAESEPSASGFAVVNGQSKAIWEGDSVAEGDLVPAGTLHLRSGRIHLELFSGVQLVIEGDSLFSIDSPMQVTMHSGRARAQVPAPARGFKIKTSSGDIVDLGTEFSVDVSKEGADVHVVEGEVELHSKLSDARRIQGGKTLRLATSGRITEGTEGRTGLIGPNEFQDLLRQQQTKQFLRWREAARNLRSDPHLIAYYRFEPDPERSRILANLATDAMKLASDGAMVAAVESADRWGRSGAALDFSPVGSRVRVNVPGEHRCLTLMCWVKINSLDRWYNSLFLTDGHEDGEPHWQIMDDGRIFFSVKLPADALKNQPEKKQPVYFSPSVWSPSFSGRWIMLCVTYDVDAKRVTHYLNGRPISSETIPDAALVESIQVGRGSICNWSEPMYRTDPNFVLRNLNGSMDEFAIYSRALSADEIHQLYRLGNPHDL